MELGDPQYELTSTVREAPAEGDEVRRGQGGARAQAGRKATHGSGALRLRGVASRWWIGPPRLCVLRTVREASVLEARRNHRSPAREGHSELRGVLRALRDL